MPAFLTEIYELQDVKNTNLSLHLVLSISLIQEKFGYLIIA